MGSRGLRSEEERGESCMKDLEFDITMSSPPFIFQLPRRIPLGPHNWNNKMDPYKLYIAKKTQEELHLPPLLQLYRQLRPLEFKIRACYNTHLEIDGDRLAKIMLIDALFLLPLFLNTSPQMETRKGTPTLPLPKFDDQNLLVNDVVKLENQIPLVVLKSILQQPNYPNVSLPVLLYHFGNSVSPVAFGFIDPKIVGDRDLSRSRVFPEILNQSHHLLHFMYMAILVSRMYRSVFVLQSCPASLNHRFHVHALTFSQKWLGKLGSVVDIVESIRELFGLIHQLFERKRNATSSGVIPSASQLHQLHFKFKPTDEGILCTKFIENPGTETQFFRTRNIHYAREIEVQLPPTLTLPEITVNTYTETVLENLLAFEAMANINPPVFARYVELMKALILAPKDVNILKKENIIRTHLENDEEVVKLFNRVGNSFSTMNENNPTTNDLHHSFQPKREIFEMINENYEKGLKGMVEEIKQCYEGFWIVKVKRYLKMIWSYAVKMFIILKLFMVARNLVPYIIGNDDVNDEPNYQMPPT